MNNEIDKVVIYKKANLSDVIKKINLNTYGICFVIDEKKRLIGSISDGDIRKKILKGINLNTQADKIMNLKVKSLNYLSSMDKILKGLNDKIKIIPLVNEKKRIVDLASFDRADKTSLVKPNFDGNELKYLTKCIKTGWISSQGNFIKKFEDKFSKFTKLKNVLAVSNGTTALQLAISTFNLGYGDEIIVPNLTFASPVNAIIHSGAKPVFVDVNKNTFCIDEYLIEKCITKKTKAIIVVHLYGHPAEMIKINKLCKKHNLILIEDCAEALGSKYKKKHVGSYGDAATFSFFANKTLTTGEGGIVCFKNRDKMKRAKLLRDHGMSNKVKYWHEDVGFNYRMTNLQAAVGTAQFERVSYIFKEKYLIVKNYKKYLRFEKNLKLPSSYGPVVNSYWLYTLTLLGTLKSHRDQIINYLMLHGIETRKVFYPMSEMPVYKKYLKKIKFKNSNEIHESTICLPSYGVNQKKIKYICDLIKLYISNNMKKNISHS